MKENRSLCLAFLGLRFGSKIVDDAGAQGKRIEGRAQGFRAAGQQPRSWERASWGPFLPELEGSGMAPPPPRCGKSGCTPGGRQERRRGADQEVKFLRVFFLTSGEGVFITLPYRRRISLWSYRACVNICRMPEGRSIRRLLLVSLQWDWEEVGLPFIKD